MIHDHESEVKRRVLVGGLVLAAIPFWAAVGVLSSLTMSAVTGPRRAPSVEVEREPARPLRLQRPGCGHFDLYLPPAWVTPRRAQVYPRLPYQYPKGMRHIGVARGHYPHLMLSGS